MVGICGPIIGKRSTLLGVIGIESLAGLEFGLGFLCSPKLTQRHGNQEVRLRSIGTELNGFACPFNCFFVMARRKLGP